MDLKALVCTQCGGLIDKSTLVCQHCGTAYAMERQNTLVIKEVNPNEVILGASAVIDPQRLSHFGNVVIEGSIEQLTYNLASQLVPFMEVQTEVDLNRQLLELYGRIKVHKTKGNVYKIYEDILQKRRS